MKQYDIAYEPIEIISTRSAWPILMLVAAVAVAAAVLILILRKRKKAGKGASPEKKNED